MYFARIVGEIVCSQKSGDLSGVKLMLVQPLDEHGETSGVLRVAADTVRAGISDLVACVGSREAALSLESNFVAVDDAIVGIVDHAGSF